MSLVDRLKQYMEHVGLPSTQFADEAKIARPTISQILNGRNRKISNEVLEKLHDAFPSLNIMWLLFGDGEMETAANTQTSRPQNAHNLFSDIYDVPAPQSVANSSAASAAPRISLESSNIEEFVQRNSHQSPSTAPTPTQDPHNIENHGPQAPITQKVQAGRDTQRRIQSIMVFYTDSSFEIFTPTVN